MAESAETGGRVKGKTVVVPIVYGNIAKYMGRKREEDGHTHNWTVYLRPYHNQDISAFIKKVHFKLHDSYEQPNRIKEKPQYEISETGWGEFEVTIKVYFVDPNEKPITIYHMLRLFETDPITKQINIKKTLTSEFYDEIIFHEPSAMMYQLLVNPSQMNAMGYRHETNFEEKKQQNLQSILEAKENVRREIEDVKGKLKAVQETIEKYKKELNTKSELNNSGEQQ